MQDTGKASGTQFIALQCLQSNAAGAPHQSPGFDLSSAKVVPWVGKCTLTRALSHRESVLLESPTGLTNRGYNRRKMCNAFGVKNLGMNVDPGCAAEPSNPGLCC